MNITREQLVEKYKIAVKKSEKLKNKTYKYITDKVCEPFGLVSQMSAINVIKAGSIIHDHDENIKKRIEQYGAVAEDFKGLTRTFAGYTLKEWDQDFKLRIEQIHDLRMIEKYETAIELFKNNFTDNDKFFVDMMKIEELGVDLEDDEEDTIDSIFG